MSRKLKISKTLSLPIEAVTQTFGILAIRGDADMSAPTHRRFSRNAMAGYVTARMRELEEKLAVLLKESPKGAEISTKCQLYELQRLYDHFNLGKDRRRPQRGTLTRYDA